MRNASPTPSTILLVDDDPYNLEVLSLCLSSYGFELSVATNGEAALKQSQIDPPNLILLDVNMPGIDGFETCRRLKKNEHTRDIPVIFMTALSDSGSKVKAFSVGAVDYVTKPIRHEEFLARVNTHLQIRSLQARLEQTITDLRQEVGERKRAEKALRKSMALTDQANERMRRDLKAAARVQQALLPESAPAVKGASFAWVYRPCAELGGDSLNVFQLDERHVGVYVLDVSGHGVPASLLSVTLSRVLTPRHDPSCLFTRVDLLAGTGALASPAEVATRLNRMFPTFGEGKQYFTMIYGVLDTEERRFRYVCAGHPAPVHVGQDTHPRICEARNLPVGLFDDEKYEESTIDLKPGDRVYLYSDGVLEAMNRKREIFDEARLLETIRAARVSGLHESVDSIVKAVLAWNGTGQVHDDLSILSVELT